MSSFDKKTVVELKAILKKKGLPVSGNKSALIERLEDHYAGSPSASSSEEVVKPRRSARNKGKVKKVVRDSSSSSDVPVRNTVKKKAIKRVVTSSSSSSSSVKNVKKRKREDTKPSSGGVIKLDENFPMSGGAVHMQYGCMLNQTNIGNNNNKFYKLQLVAVKGSYYTYVRYGRVGEAGRGQKKGPYTESDAIMNYKKQFKLKTGNEWDNRDAFVEKKGKYKIIEIDYEDDDLAEVAQALESIDNQSKVVKKKIKECTLDDPTKKMIKLIFDNDMFKTQMASFELDIKKMPLGKLSKTQVEIGFEILEEMEDALENGGNMENLSNKFYTHVPHAFGRKRPPIIRDPESIQKKKDMLNVLSDIVVAQNLLNQKTKENEEQDSITEIDHPLDVNFNALTCDMKSVPQDTETFQKIADYLENTTGSFELEIEDLFEIRRHGEEERFAEFDHIDHRKLLWHGTNVAVVVAILKGGLRIMPHSGGRVGKGIYFASENSKSAAYVGCLGDTGIMFLSEVAIGEQNIITRDDSSLKKPPTGFDSVLAAGHTEPDPALNSTLEIDGRNVIIPQGKPIKMPEYAHSSFSQSEYLIYKESQNRLRYMLKLKFGKRRGNWH